MSFLRSTKKHIQHAFDGLVWDLSAIAVDLVTVGIAYARVILKRSGLWFSKSVFTAVVGGEPLITGFKYNRVLDGLGWGDRTGEPWGFTPESGADKSQHDYLKAAAQTLLLNSKNSASFGHSFHVLSPSQLPIVFALTLGVSVLFILLGLRSSYHDVLAFAHCVALAAFASVIVGWILMAFREEVGGAHTLEVQQSFRIGIVLFIASELMLFFAFFWAYFHFCLNPSAVTNGQFVAEGIVPFFWYRIPLVNTVILLSSGISLTLAHGLINFADRTSRAREWQQVLISGVFLLQNPEYKAVSELSAICNGRLVSLSRTVRNGGDLIEGVPAINFDRMYSSSLLDAPHLIADLIHNDKFALFRWSDEVRLHNAVGYAFANAHNLTNVQDSDYSYLPNRSVSYFFPVVSRFERNGGHFIESANTLTLSLRNHRIWVLDTVVRGAVFLTLQAYEYISGLFTISDSVYGGVFYSLTGLHGLHVFIGVLMLLGAYLFESQTTVSDSYYIGSDNPGSVISLLPYTGYVGLNVLESGHLNSNMRSSRKFTWWYHRVAFDGVAWYWHFVDVVWLFVFIFVYWYSFPANYVV